MLWWAPTFTPAFNPKSLCLSVSWLLAGRGGLPCTCLSSVSAPPHTGAGPRTGKYCRSLTPHTKHSHQAFLLDLPYPREHCQPFKTLLFLFPDAAQRRQADFCSLEWEMQKALAERAAAVQVTRPSQALRLQGRCGFPVHRVEILDAESVQTDPAFAPLPTTVNLFLSCWSCSVEPEIWKNLTRSGFKHRKTLFKVNTGIPPSSCRNVEPAGSELSSFSEKPLLNPISALHPALHTSSAVSSSN